MKIMFIFLTNLLLKYFFFLYKKIISKDKRLVHTCKIPTSVFHTRELGGATPSPCTATVRERGSTV